MRAVLIAETESGAGPHFISVGQRLALVLGAPGRKDRNRPIEGRHSLFVFERLEMAAGFGHLDLNFSQVVLGDGCKRRSEGADEKRCSADGERSSSHWYT